MKARQSKSGVALLMVLVTLFLVSIIGYEIIFAAGVESRISRNARNRLQATYMAQSAVRLSILRLYLYKEAKNISDKSKQNLVPEAQINQIWSLALPPLPLPGMKVSWPGTSTAIIRSEGSKIPINMLDANKHRRSNDEKAKSVKEQITNLIKGLSEDEEFDKLYRGLLPEELVNPLKDWIDADANKEGGGDENNDYERFDPPYTPRNNRIPALSELHMIKGWTDDLIQRIAGNFSIFNSDTEVSPNFISLTRLKAVCPDLSLEDLATIQKKRFESPFGTLDELFTFITSSPDIKTGARCQKGTLVDLSRESHFIVEGSGLVGDARRGIKLYVRLSEDVPKNQQGQATSSSAASSSPTDSTGATRNPGDPASKPKYPLLDPKIVFVEESL